MVEMKPYTEILIDLPTTFTVAAANTTEKIFAEPYKFVLSFIVRVRTMGTATYVRLGNQYAQDYSLVVKGQTFEWTGNPGQVVDMSKLYAISDTNDAVLEIIADYVSIDQQSCVRRQI